MRHLYLVNDLGIEYHFDYRTSTLYASPTGLGIIKENTYLKFDDDYLLIKEDNPIAEIGGSLIFLNQYKGYNTFLEYLKGSKSLELHYHSNSKKYCNVNFKSISKTELISGVLQCEVVIERLGLWRVDVVVEIDVDVNNSAKIYPFTYPYTYSISFEGKIKVTNNGFVKAPLIIEINGAFDNPEVLIKKNDEVVSMMRMYLKSNDCKLVVNSEVTNQKMTLFYKTGEEVDVYQYQDFTCDNFIFIDPGTYEIEFRPGVSASTTCKLTFIEGYIGN